VAILSLGVLLAAFLLGLVLGAPYIRLLHRLRMGKHIRREGPQSHYAKQGTPTLGGVLVIAVVVLLWLIVFAVLDEPQQGDFVAQTIVPIGALIAVGILGFIDDYIDILYGFGIRGRHKLAWQLVVALVGSIYIQRHFAITGVFVPLVGEVEIGAVTFVALAVFAIISTSNGVNLIDGLDGLSGGTLVFAFLSFAFIAAARGFPWLVVVCSAIVGALLAFLWFNAHPAEVIMGDVGSLALGATLATVALTTGFILLLPVVGFLYVVENLSVILQVGSFKLRGRRIFRMAPIHHHFELIGWPEQKVTIRFWLIAALAGIIGAILAFVTPVK
jgi:phospho-N-acetylmuramoyl-pentapeptide-transferase